MSPATVHHTEAVFSFAREIYGREHGSSFLDRQVICRREHDDPMDDLHVNMAI